MPFSLLDTWLYRKKVREKSWKTASHTKSLSLSIAFLSPSTLCWWLLLFFAHAYPDLTGLMLCGIKGIGADFYCLYVHNFFNFIVFLYRTDMIFSLPFKVIYSTNLSEITKKQIFIIWLPSKYLKSLKIKSNSWKYPFTWHHMSSNPTTLETRDLKSVHFLQLTAQPSDPVT